MKWQYKSSVKSVFSQQKAKNILVTLAVASYDVLTASQGMKTSQCTAATGKARTRGKANHNH